MDAAKDELERRDRYLRSLVHRVKLQPDSDPESDEAVSKHTSKSGRVQTEAAVRVRAADMAPAMQRHAFRCAHQELAAMPKLGNKRLALALKKEFDAAYGPAWHCIVGTSFGSYVTHSLGGFLYFSVDKVHVLLFRTAVDPSTNHK